MTFVRLPLTLSARPRGVASALGALSLGALLLAACASPTPYAPRLQGEETGYTDMEITPTRYRVTFTGNSLTPREKVETYLLLRAAEVTRAAGYQYFVFDTRNTRARTIYNAVPGVMPDPWFWGGYPYYRSYWGGWGWGGWGGWGFAYRPSVDIITRTNYQAYAEIVLLTPEQAKKEPRAIKASEVIRHLGPDAVLPDAKDRPVRPAPPPPPRG